MSWRRVWPMLLATACTTDAPPPGDQVLGIFGFSAAPLAVECALAELSDGGSGLASLPFSFTATLTAESNTQRAWLTLSRYSRDASWDGQDFTSVAVASRVFPMCEACQTTVEERLQVALLSQSQAEALHGLCPADALDGGVPRPNRDAGITGPVMTATGFDATRACGTLTETIHSLPLLDAGSCPPECEGCVVHFGLDGARQ